MDQTTDETATDNGTSNGVHTNGQANGNDNGNGASASEVAQIAESNGASYASSALPSSEIKRDVTQKLFLRLRESQRPDADKYLLMDVKNLLMEYQGQDEVNLEIASEGRIILMEWPMVRVNACAELEERLQSLLGDLGHAFVETK